MTEAGARGAGGGRAARPPLALTAAAASVVAAVSLPLVYLVIRAGSSPSAWEVLGRDRMAALVLDTVVLVAAVTAGAVALAVPLAWLVARTDLPLRRTMAVAAALPLVIPSYVAALALLGAFGPRGMLQQALEEPFGVERVPPIYGFTGAVGALVLTTYPYVYLLVLAALRRTDPALEEAARSLGRTRLQAFRTVTLPALRPAAGAGALLVALYTLSDFGAVSLMRYDSLTRAVYLQYRALFDRTPAAVLALVLVLLTAVVLVLESSARRRSAPDGARTGSPRAAAPVALGRWRWAAFAACLVVVAIAFVVPVAVLLFWALRGASLGASLAPAWAPAANSLLASTAAAAAAVAAALPVAVLATRYRSWWSRGLERLSYASNALPGIVIALALVFFAARYATPVYQTFALLLVAYVVRFLPQAMAGTHSALVRFDPRLEEAGRSLGRGPAAVFTRVTAPLVAPGLLAGAALVFLSTMKELPATLLLRPIGFETLATEVWTATTVSAYSQAAVPALLLVVLAAPLVYVLAVRGSIADDGAVG